ncbi:hypothetical protein SLS54_008332 [Diplodia seriata]
MSILLEHSTYQKSAHLEHVFSDLRAYVCTFEHCSDMMFADSYSWSAHEFDEHRQELSCQLCHNTYTSENEFQKHVTSKHSMKASSTQLTALTRAALHQKEEVGAGECPFCDEWENALRSVNEHIPEDQPVLVPRQQYRRHVAHHMENLALFAITPHIAESDEEALYGSNEAALHELDDPSKHKGERHFATLFDDEEAEEAPLHFAAANGLFEDVKLLLDGGEDPNSLNAAGTTAVELAEYEGHHEITNYLCKRGAQKHNAQRRVGTSRGACLRCKLTRDLCVGGDPCIRCTKAHNRSWQIPCTSVDIKDMGDFVNSSLLDAPSGYSPQQYESFTTPEYPPTPINLHYGSGLSLVIMVQKSPVSDDDSLRVSWDEYIHKGLQEFSVLRTETWITKPGEPLRPKIAEYIKDYVDDKTGKGFYGGYLGRLLRPKNELKSYYSISIFEVVWRYYRKTNETILGKALHLYVAFSLVGRPTLMEGDSIGEDTEGRVTIPNSRYYGETLAPGRIDKAIKYELTALWRSYHYEVLEELSSLFTSVYSGDRLRNWTAIFTVTITLLMVWEKMQYEFHRKDATKGEELCAEMERIAVPVLTGLVQAISQKLPSFIEWDTEKHQHLLGSNEATNCLMWEIGRLVTNNGMVFVTRILKKTVGEDNKKTEVFMTANRSVTRGLTSSAVISSWLWSTAMLGSSLVGYQYGVSGPFWFAAGCSPMIVFFALLGISCKRKIPEAHTLLEIIRIRYGNIAHIVYMVLCLLNNLFACANMLLGASAVITAIFLTDYLHTFTILIILCFFTVKAFTVEEIGSLSNLFDILQQAGIRHPVSGNHDGSYLTMTSKGGILFGIIHICANFGLVIMDTSFFIKAFAASPSAVVPGYVIGGIAYFAIPWATGTLASAIVLGLESSSSPLSPTYPRRMTETEVSAGLVLPYAFMAVAGRGAGAACVLLITFMAVTSTLSAQLIAVSSILAFDVYRTYMRPRATDADVIRASHAGVVAFAVVAAAFSTLLHGVGIDLGWTLYMLGIVTCPGIFPTALAVLWRGQSRAAAVGAPVLGMATGIAVWLGTAYAFEGEIGIASTGATLPCMYGTVAATFFAAWLVVAIVWLWGTLLVAGFYPLVDGRDQMVAVWRGLRSGSGTKSRKDNIGSSTSASDGEGNGADGPKSTTQQSPGITKDESSLDVIARAEALEK